MDLNRLIIFNYLLNFLSINLVVFCLLYGFMITYNPNHPFFSKMVDQILFICISVTTTYFSSILLTYSYFYIKNDKRGLPLEGLYSKAVKFVHKLKILFFYNIIFGIFFFGMYVDQAGQLGYFVLITTLVYVSIFSIISNCIIFKVNFDFLNKNYDLIRIKYKNPVLYNIFLYFVFIFILFIVSGIIVTLLWPDNYQINSSLLGILFFYPFCIIGIMLILITQRSRLALDILFSENFWRR